MYQTPINKRLDRKDHVWLRQQNGNYKCCLCGAVVEGSPPDYPTDKDWLPRRYEPLTEDEREAVPYKGRRR